MILVLIPFLLHFLVHISSWIAGWELRNQKLGRWAIDTSKQYSGIENSISTFLRWYCDNLVTVQVLD